MMKIDINKIKVVPKSISSDFALCVYGIPDNEVQQWIDENAFEANKTKDYTNIIIPKDIALSEIFYQTIPFEYMDGFSPNLNKKLHIGHFSNLVLTKAFKALGICNKTVSIYGDTLGDGEIDKTTASSYIIEYQNNFMYHPSKAFFASGVKYNGILLKHGTREYEGTRIFQIGENKVVGIKSNGQTTYFYQDVALAEELKAPTIYLTGKEQCNHFELLKEMFPHITHIGLGLVKVSGIKMASRVGNVILMEDFIEQSKAIFNNNMQLIYNVFAGFILKSNPEVDKNINLDIISNPKNSAGLYLSYTMARLTSAGCEPKHNTGFYSRELEFAYLKSKENLKPNILFEVLLERCKDINSLYMEHTIKDNDNNKRMFELKLADLICGCNKLGLFIIDKV